MLLWGPPGTGKITLAKLLADNASCHWISLSAVLAGVKEIRGAVAQARQNLTQGHRTVLFVDEVHRFNKAQQDAFFCLCRGRYSNFHRRHNREPIL